jgi:lambda repressor-like predicted transcriptional regulator
VLAPVFRTIGQGLRAMGAAFSGEGVTSDGFVGVMERIGVAARSLVDWFQANWPRIREIVAQVLDQVQVVIDNIISWVRDHWPEIQEVIAQVLDTVRSVISGAVTVILTLWRNFGDNILSFLRRAWNPIKQIVEGALTVVRGIIQTITSLIKGDWSGVWDGIKKIFSGVWEALQGIVKGALEAIRLAIGFVLEIIGSIFKKAWDGIKTVASNAWDGIVDFFGKLPGRFGGVLSGVADAITAPFKTAFNLIADLWNNTVGKLRFEIPSWVPRIGGKGWDVPDIPKFAHGAVVRRPTLAVVGDAGPGNPEIVAPERMLRRIVTDALTIAPLTRSTATVVNTTNITVNALDARGTQDAVVRALNDYRRRNGRLPWEAVA